MWLWILVGFLLALAALWLDNRVTGREPWPWMPGKGKRRDDKITLRDCVRGMILFQKTRPKNPYPGRPSRLRLLLWTFKPLQHNKKS